MERVRTRTVRLEAKQAVEIKPGVMLPAGYHTAIKTRTGLETRSSNVSWTPPQFSIKFTADELASMGATDTEKVISVEIDVTEFVRSGQLAQK